MARKGQKSTRHSKITAEYSEALILYWLSKSGCECAKLDHTGIDLIARVPSLEKKPIGISVKSRSRFNQKRGDSMNIEVAGMTKATKACDSFGCIPYYAIVIDEDGLTYAFLLSLKKLQALFPKGKRVRVWEMHQRFLARYKLDPEILMFTDKHESIGWVN